MKASGIRTPIIAPRDDIAEVFFLNQNAPLVEKSLLIITSKVISVTEEGVVSCKSKEDLKILVEKEADEVLGKSNRYDFWLTKKNGYCLPNAGIDQSNTAEGTALLLPKDAVASARKIRKKIQEKTGVKDFGVIICDSRVLPFRRGISGIALSWDGFVGISDERGKKDIYGKPLKVSEIAVADNLASMAQVFFGQANEQIPFVLTEGAPVTFTDEKQDCRRACIPPKEDLFAEFLSRSYPPKPQ